MPRTLTVVVEVNWIDWPEGTGIVVPAITPANDGSEPSIVTRMLLGRVSVVVTATGSISAAK